MLTATTMTGSKKTLKERIYRIAQRPKMTAVTLLALIIAAALAVGCTFTGAETQSEEELTNLFCRAATSDEIAQVMEAFVRRSMEDDGGVMLVQSSDGIGYGYGLSAERCEELAELFAQYQWEKVESQPARTANEVLTVELSTDRGTCTIEIDPRDEACLWVAATLFKEDADTVEWELGRTYRAVPKDVAPSLYEVLCNLYDQQKADTDQTITETQVTAAVEDTAQWWMGADEPIAMSEKEMQECKMYLQWFDWTPIENWDDAMEPAGESIFILQGKERIEFFDGSDFVCCTSPSGSAYYSLTPQSDEIQPIWDIMRTMYEHRGQ